MKKKIFASVLAITMLAIIFLVTGCGKEESLNPTITGGDFKESTDFNKILMNLYSEQEMMETSNGFYYVGDNEFLRYYDKKTGKTTIVCNKPNCKHTGETCGGAIYASYLQYYDNKLYFHQYTDGGRYIYSMDLDGSNYKKVQELENNYNYMFADNAPFIIHRGIVYYVISTGEIMANKLGADSKNAKAIFKDIKEDPKFDGGMQVWQDNVTARILYADGDYFYLRLMKKENNKYVETFFRYNATNGHSEQVFQIPSEKTVGNWDEAGVKSQGWYIEGNNLYYFLSSNGLWKYNMETKENKKVIDLPKVKGLANMDAKYLYINNGSNIDKSKITESQSAYSSIKVYEIETGNFIHEIKYADFYKNGKYNDFKIAGLTSGGILLAGDNKYSGVKTYYYADRTDIKNASFKKMDFGIKIQDEESKMEM